MKQLLESLRSETRTEGIDAAVAAFAPVQKQNRRNFLPFGIATAGALAVISAPLWLPSSAKAVTVEAVKQAMSKQPRVVQEFRDADGHVYLRTWRDGNLKRMDMFQSKYGTKIGGIGSAWTTEVRAFNGDTEITIVPKDKVVMLVKGESASFGIADGIPFNILTLVKARKEGEVHLTAYYTSDAFVGSGKAKNIRGRTDYTIEPKSLLPTAVENYQYRNGRYELRAKGKFEYPVSIPAATFSPEIPVGFRVIRN